MSTFSSGDERGRGVIGREIVIAPARHTNTAWKVITFTTGCKVTQPFTPQNKRTVKLKEIFVKGPCCGCYENGDCAGFRMQMSILVYK